MPYTSEVLLTKYICRGTFTIHDIHFAPTVHPDADLLAWLHYVGGWRGSFTSVIPPIFFNEWGQLEVRFPGKVAIILSISESNPKGSRLCAHPCSDLEFDEGIQNEQKHRG